MHVKPRRLHQRCDCRGFCELDTLMQLCRLARDKMWTLTVCQRLDQPLEGRSAAIT